MVIKPIPELVSRKTFGVVNSIFGRAEAPWTTFGQAGTESHKNEMSQLTRSLP
jgi:hypothetical protein